MPASLAKYAKGAALPATVAIVLLSLWEAAVRGLGIRSIILPSPSAILEVMVTRYDLLLTHLWPSLYLTLLGFVLSVVGGVLVAILITYSRILREGFFPIIVISQVIPKVSIAPLFIVWFGTGTMSSLLLAFLVAFFPMTINAAMGFQSIDEEIHRMARTFMGSRWQIFWKIRMPNIGVIVSEFVASQEGIGYLIKLAGGLLDTPLMMAAIAVLSIGGLALYGIIAQAETKAIYWQPPADGGAGAGGA